jgi:hypothetical protein
MRNIVLFSLAIVLFSCKEVGQKDCIDKTKVSGGEMCTDQYAPVCGCDGKKYTNVCRAKSAGVTSWDEGECSKKK